MGAVPASHDNGHLSCGRTGDAVPVGVMTEYNDNGPREGERAWHCDEVGTHQFDEWVIDV